MSNDIIYYYIFSPRQDWWQIRKFFPSLTSRIITASLKSQGLVVYQAEKWHDMTGVGPTEVRSDRQPRSPRHSSEVIRGRWEEPGVNSLHELRNHQESIFLPLISSESNTKLLAHIKYSIFSISFCFGSQLKKKFPFHTLCEGCFFLWRDWNVILWVLLIFRVVAVGLCLPGYN